MQAMLSPLTCVLVVLRHRDGSSGSARQEPHDVTAADIRSTIGALSHVADLVSAFLDAAIPARWSIARASKRGDLRLLHRVAAREAPGDPFLRALAASKALVVAARYGHLEVVRWLSCEYCTHVVPFNAMRKAASRGHLHVLAWLLERHANVQPTLFIAEKAAQNGHLPVLQWLLPRMPDAAADHEAVFSNLLCDAARNGHLEVVRWLLQHYRFPAATDARNGLAGAITNGHFEVARFLAVQGYRLEEWHRGQLAFCAQRGDLEMVQWVHAQQFVHDNVAWIDVAAAAGHLHIVQWVHENTDDFCSVDAMNRAAKSGHLEIVQWLHANRAEGCSNLAMAGAAEFGHLEVVQWLHEHRSEGCTTLAMDSAAGAGHLEIVQWLHAHRSEGCSTAAMDRAAASGHLDIVKWLHEHRSEGCTTAAMDGAAARGHLEVVQWLHAHRTEGCTTAAMDMAARNDHLHVVEWLHANRSEGCTVAAMDYTRSLRMLEWLYDNRMERCTYKSTVMAAFQGDLEKLMFLKEKGIALIDEGAMIEAVICKNFEIFQWLRVNYPEHTDMEEIELSLNSYPSMRSAWTMLVQFEAGCSSPSEEAVALEQLRSH